MTDITNTKITRKTESYGNDYKAMKTEAMILQKKGAPFMMASVVIWTLVTITRMLPVDITTKNLSVQQIRLYQHCKPDALPAYRHVGIQSEAGCDAHAFRDGIRCTSPSVLMAL